MAALHIPRVLALLYLSTCLYPCTTVSGAEYDEFDFDGLPGVQHEFKIEVPAGREECFHQKVAEGANLHMSFEVLKGADRLVDVFLKDPNFYVVSSNIAQSSGQFDLPTRTSDPWIFINDSMPISVYHTPSWSVKSVGAWLFGMVMEIMLDMVLNGHTEEINVYLRDTEENIDESSSVYGENRGNIEKGIEVEGVYTICVDNTFSRMASKLVYVYLITFVPEEWTKYVQEIEAMNMAVTNFTNSITIVQESVEAAKLHQASSRMNVIKDWYLIMGNNSYIVKWSIAQMVVILGSSIFTVFFVRRLFKVSNVTPSQKPRA